MPKKNESWRAIGRRKSSVARVALTIGKGRFLVNKREVREYFGERVCNQMIPRSVRLSEAPSYGQPITVFDPTSRGAVAYKELAKEVLNE